MCSFQNADTVNCSSMMDDPEIGGRARYRVRTCDLPRVKRTLYR